MDSDVVSSSITNMFKNLYPERVAQDSTYYPLYYYSTTTQEEGETEMNESVQVTMYAYSNGGIRVLFRWAEEDCCEGLTYRTDQHVYSTVAEANKDIAHFLNGTGDWA